MGGETEKLRTSLPLSDAAFLRGKKGKILEASRSAVQVCRRASPESVLAAIQGSATRGDQLADDSLRKNWLARLLARRLKTLREAFDTVAAVQRGYELTVERLDEILEQHHMREIDCLNQPFDHHSMNAADVEQTNRVPEGTVVASRRGHEWRGEIVRTAQVKLARRK